MRPNRYASLLLALLFIGCVSGCPAETSPGDAEATSVTTSPSAEPDDDPDFNRLLPMASLIFEADAARLHMVLHAEGDPKPIIDMTTLIDRASDDIRQAYIQRAPRDQLREDPAWRERGLGMCRDVLCTARQEVREIGDDVWRFIHEEGSPVPGEWQHSSVHRPDGEIWNSRMWVVLIPYGVKDVSQIPADDGDIAFRGTVDADRLRKIFATQFPDAKPSGGWIEDYDGSQIDMTLGSDRTLSIRTEMFEGSLEPFGFDDQKGTVVFTATPLEGPLTVEPPTLKEGVHPTAAQSED